MRLPLKAAALLAGAMLLQAPPAVEAADLSVTAKSVRGHYKRLRVVADYDGTPVVVRRHRVVGMDYYGNRVIEHRIVHQPVIGYPTHYFNGQPIRTTYLVRSAYLVRY